LSAPRNITTKIAAATPIPTGIASATLDMFLPDLTPDK
jgi:hypothetical protein